MRRRYAPLPLLLLLPAAATPRAHTCAPPAAPTPPVDVSKVFGRVQFVDAFPDYKVEVVDAFPDLKVQQVSAFADSAGEWEVVTAFPDFKIQKVTAFADFRVQFVTSFPGTGAR